MSRLSVTGRFGQSSYQAKWLTVPSALQPYPVPICSSFRDCGSAPPRPTQNAAAVFRVSLVRHRADGTVQLPETPENRAPVAMYPDQFALKPRLGVASTPARACGATRA